MKHRMLIAVYGTLRKGWGANALLDECEYIGVDRLQGTLYDLGGFPGYKDDGSNGTVVCEVYEVPEGAIKVDNLLRSLDRYEGFRANEPNASLYIRKEVKTLRMELPVQTYIYNFKVNEHTPVIPSGDWANKERKPRLVA